MTDRRSCRTHFSLHCSKLFPAGRLAATLPQNNRGRCNWWWHHNRSKNMFLKLPVDPHSMVFFNQQWIWMEVGFAERPRGENTKCSEFMQTYFFCWFDDNPCPLNDTRTSVYRGNICTQTLASAPCLNSPQWAAQEILRSMTSNVRASEGLLKSVKCSRKEFNTTAALSQTQPQCRD